MPHLNQWEWRPAKWYNLKYRGGTYLYPRIWEPHERHLPEKVNDAVQWSIGLREEGRAFWSIIIEKGRNVIVDADLEVIVVKFKKKEDAAYFRLAFVDE